MDRVRGRAAGSGDSHSVVGRYTPDGAVGRALLALLLGPVAVVAFWFAIVGFAAPGALSTALGLFYAALSVGGTLLALVLLWPVYLSLIGELESTADYRSGSAGDRSESRDATDPLAVLKREYAAGDLTEREFERRLERILGVEAVEDSRAESALQGTDAARAREPARRSRCEDGELEEAAGRPNS